MEGLLLQDLGVNIETAQRCEMIAEYTAEQDYRYKVINQAD